MFLCLCPVSHPIIHINETRRQERIWTLFPCYNSWCWPKWFMFPKVYWIDLNSSSNRNIDMIQFTSSFIAHTVLNSHSDVFHTLFSDTVDGRNPKQPPRMCKPLWIMVDELLSLNLVNAGFLNHQPISLYFPLIGTLFPLWGWWCCSIHAPICGGPISRGGWLDSERCWDLISSKKCAFMGSCASMTWIQELYMFFVNVFVPRLRWTRNVLIGSFGWEWDGLKKRCCCFL